jgi:uncharacterized repeat protein (TIGR02543 family)
MKKRIISVLLALTMCLSMLGMTALATGTTPPLELTSSVSGTTVTLTLKTTGEVTFTSLDTILTYPEGLTVSTVSEVSNNALSNFESNKEYSGSSARKVAANFQSASTTAAATITSGTALVTYTFDATDVTYGSYQFTVTVSDVSNKFDSNANFDWKNGTTSTSVTLGTHTHSYSGDPVWKWTGDDTDGYTAATATWTCSAGDNCDGSEGKTVTKTATLSAVAANADANATCEKTGTGTVTATISASDSPTGQEVTAKQTSVTVPVGAHKLTETPKAEPSCYQTGKKAYWTCSVCNKVFADEAGTQQLTGADDASLTIAATGNHSYDSDGKCTTEGCNAEAPDFSAYYVIYDADNQNEITANEDGVNGLDVTAGTTYTARVYLKAGKADQAITSFDLILTYPADYMTVASVSGQGVADDVYTETSGQIQYQLSQPTDSSSNTQSIATDGTLVAAFKFTVKADVQYDTAMTLGFSSAVVSQSPSSFVEIPVTTTGMEIGTLSKITVTWNLNGGNVDGNTNTLTTSITRNTAATAPTATIVKGGYTLTGWQLSGATEDNKTVYGADQTAFPTLTQDTEYVAKWTAKEYTVTYVLDGGTLEGLTDSAKTYTTLDGDLGTPTKTGYTFEGWTITKVTESDLSTTSTADKTLSLTGHYGNVTVTANWSFAMVTLSVEYAYASESGSLLIVSAMPDEGKTMTYDGQAMYYVAGTGEDAWYYQKLVTGQKTPVDGATGVYVTVLDAAYDSMNLTQTATSDDLEALTFPTGNLYDVNQDGKVNATDAGGVYQLIKNRALTKATVLQRLLADVNHDFKADIDDVTAIVTNFTRTTASTSTEEG